MTIATGTVRATTLSDCSLGPQHERSDVLVVDDEDAITRMFRMVLRHYMPDRRVDVAANGKEAVQSFLEGRHQVILLDLHMPVMDGQTAFQEIQRICAERDWRMPSIVFCTGFAPPKSVELAIAGSDAHCLMQKPVPNDALVAAVKSRLA